MAAARAATNCPFSPSHHRSENLADCGATQAAYVSPHPEESVKRNAGGVSNHEVRCRPPILRDAPCRRSSG